ncbi:MAG: DoxX family membrane protein [Pseudomonadota bacterium]
MTMLLSLQRALFEPLNRADWLLTTLARFLFAAILLIYFWKSALTKLGDGILGIFRPSDGAYAQIFPKLMESVSYNTSELGLYEYVVVLAGTWAEFILPFLVVVGLLTRLASLGMIGFIVVMSLTDLYGHGAISEASTLGAWFDGQPGGIILDQRALWIFLLLTLVIKGGGPLSVDRILMRRAEHRQDVTE